MEKRFFKNYPDVLTPTEVGGLLGIGRNKVYQLLADGTIPALRIDRRYIIPKSGLIKMLDECYNDDMGDSSCVVGRR